MTPPKLMWHAPVWRLAARCVLSTCLVGAGHVGLQAQNTFPASLSNLSGVVVDATHAGIPGVTVAIEDLARRVTHRFRTDGQGRFEAKDLPAGNYEAEVSVPGFVVFREPVLLTGPQVEREIVLTVGPLQETITVGPGARRAETSIRREVVDTEPCVVPTDETTLSPVGGRFRPPRMVSRTTPSFPEHLLRDEVEGTVRLEGRIAENGTVGALVVVDGAHPDFAVAAEEAVRDWTWEPPLLNCTPVEVGLTVIVRFVPGAR